MYASASGGFSLFGGRETKYMDAADLYIQAANAFRMQKMSTSPRAQPRGPPPPPLAKSPAN